MNKTQYYPLSFSSLKAYSTSPAHFIAYKQRKQHETPAMRFGTAVHMAVLEPERFKQEYKTLKVRRGTAAYKALVEEHPEATWLSVSEAQEISNVADAIAKHPYATTLLQGCTKFEQELTGNLHGLPFRGFADGVALTYTVDLKTAMKGGPRDFTSDAYRQKYHVQGYIYTKLLSQHVGYDVGEHWIISVEKTAPYVVTCYKLTSEYLDRGAKDLATMLDSFKNWDGLPSGYDQHAPQGFFSLDVPAWAL